MAKSDAKTTRQQELGSAWIFRRALKDNKKYNRWEDILNDPKYKELGGRDGIYPGVDAVWLKTFYLQQKKMLIEFSDAKFTEFNREHGFMDYVSNLVKEKFGISKKDNWDPADIWCIKNQKKVIGDLDKLIKSGDYDTIEQLNMYLRTLFKERIVVGISLKKVSGKEAKYEEVNVKEDIEFKDVKNPDFQTIKMNCNLTIKDLLSPGVKAAHWVVQGLENNSKVDFDIEIGPQSSSSFSFTKFEVKSSAARSARLGKAKLEYVRQLFTEYGIALPHDSALDYPKNSAEWVKRQDEFIKMFRLINSNRNIETGISSEKEFITNMTKYFMNVEKGLPVTANNKCQQVAVFAALSKLTSKKLNELGTKIVIASQKKGDGQYGPFGKLY
jgi:hypothetical protein